MRHNLLVQLIFSAFLGMATAMSAEKLDCVWQDGSTAMCCVNSTDCGTTARLLRLDFVNSRVWNISSLRRSVG
ncbi:hypothetical protein V1527DRAFT_474665 [Lipomyces starkeyi]